MNNDLKSLIELHTFNALEKMNIHTHDEKDNQQSGKMGLNDEQAHLMISALEIKEKKVLSFMIPIKNVFMIDYDDILDKYKLSHILDKGYSRIPVYSNHNKNDIVGLLRIKQLIGVDFNQNKSLRQLGIELRKPIVVSPSVSIIDLLREFRKGKSHMAFITEQVEDLQNKFGLNRSNSIKKDFTKELLYGKELEMHNIFVLGIITLEDIIEKMINLDILDEDDYEKVTRNTRKKPVMKNSSINLFFVY
jgi:CBS domain containing-hemolysin-like protein